MRRYEGLTLDAERALYGVRDAEITDCVFDGPADGESALKETAGLRVANCLFRLRYPLWHCHGAQLSGCIMTDTCRAALWYDSGLTFEDCSLGGIKALRECDGTVMRRCRIDSREFGWFCRGLRMEDCDLVSEYPFLQCRDLELSGLKMQAKYSLQYVEGATLRRCELDTKDAFWHSKNVTVYDSVLRGEYLAWYSENLRLVHCKIIGTQPLCYAKGLVLEDCEMVDCDLAFENSSVRATVRGGIDSVKNPAEGRIEADRIGEVILDEFRNKAAHCEILRRADKTCA